MCLRLVLTMAVLFLAFAGCGQPTEKIELDDQQVERVNALRERMSEMEMKQAEQMKKLRDEAVAAQGNVQ